MTKASIAELDIARLEEFAPFYDQSHKLPALEEDWFAQRHLAPTNVKFRGCSLRWWQQGAVEPNGEFRPFKRKQSKNVDLSILD